MKTITQVATELGVKVWHVRHALDSGYVSKPSMFGGRFVFQDGDVTALRNYFTRSGNGNHERHDYQVANE